MDLQDSDSLNAILDELESVEYVAFDLETNSSVEKIARPIGIGVSFYTDEGFYFPLAKYDSDRKELVPIVPKKYEEEFVQALCEILLKKKLIMWGGVYDIAVMWHYYGISLLEALYADPMLMKHTVDEERPFGLKEVAEIYKLQIGFTEEEAANQEQLDLKESVVSAGGKWNQKNKDIYMGDMSLIGTYCIADCDLTLKLFEYFQDRLENENLTNFFYNQEVMPLYLNATIPMKIGGVKIDVDYFRKLEKELESDIMKLTSEVFDTIREDIQPLVEQILEEKIKETRTGNFAEGVLQYYNIPIPSNKKTGKPTFAKNVLKSLLSTFPDHPALLWILHTPRKVSLEVLEECEESREVEENGILVNKIVKCSRKIVKEVSDEKDIGPQLPKNIKLAVKKQIWINSKPDLPEVFNLSSNDHISWLLFDFYKEDPRSYSRETGDPQVNKDSLETYDHLPFIQKLLELKKHEKLLSTYVIPILEKQIDGWLYPSMFQFGTTSGRYACGGGLNLQTLPRDDKRVKRGFIAPKGYKIVNADFASLEPRIFSWVSGDPGLKRVWQQGLDLYSQIAIDVLGLEGVSARESDKNYLKKIMPEKRDQSKRFCLSVPYGANAWRISEQMKISPEEAKDIIERYLGAYPGLEDYMMTQELEARTKGSVRTKFGRIRHLPECKALFKTYRNTLYNKNSMKKLFKEARDENGFGSKIYYEYRTYLNNAKNSPIQMTAAHVCNAAMIKMAKAIVDNDIDGWICLTIHDEITCIIREDQTELAAKLLKDSMENNWVTNEIDIPIIAEPIIGSNFAESK